MPLYRISEDQGNYDFHLPYKLEKIPFGYEAIRHSSVASLKNEDLAEIIEAKMNNNQKRVNELLSRYHTIQ